MRNYCLFPDDMGNICKQYSCRKNYELSRLMYSRGIHLSWQIFSRVIGFALVTMVTLGIFALCFGTATGRYDFGIAELRTADTLSALVFAIKLTPVILMFAAMHVMLICLIPLLIYIGNISLQGDSGVLKIILCSEAGNQGADDVMDCIMQKKSIMLFEKSYDRSDALKSLEQKRLMPCGILLMTLMAE